MSLIDASNPVPGFHAGVSFERYVSIPLLNHSTIKLAAKSPKHFRWALDNPEEAATESDSKRLGTGTHMLLFEPEQFNSLRIAPPINPKTEKPYGSDSQKWAEYAAANPGKFIVSDQEVTAMRQMVESIRSNPGASDLLDAATSFEETAIWRDPITGLWCKGRLDGRVEGVCLLDIKTTRDLATFPRSIIDYSYHTQNVWYCDGMEAMRRPETKMIFIAVENTAPYDCQVVEIEEETLSMARELVRGWRETVRRCQQTGRWYGVQGDPLDLSYRRVTTVGAPAWYRQKFMDAEETQLAA